MLNTDKTYINEKLEKELQQIQKQITKLTNEINDADNIKNQKIIKKDELTTKLNQLNQMKARVNNL